MTASLTQKEQYRLARSNEDITIDKAEEGRLFKGLGTEGPSTRDKLCNTIQTLQGTS